MKEYALREREEVRCEEKSGVEAAGGDPTETLRGDLLNNNGTPRQQRRLIYYSYAASQFSRTTTTSEKHKNADIILDHIFIISLSLHNGSSYILRHQHPRSLR
jgi:hypothetical protein